MVLATLLLALLHSELQKLNRFSHSVCNGVNKMFYKVQISLPMGEKFEGCSRIQGLGADPEIVSPKILNSGIFC